MSTKNCGHKVPCGCGDTALTTPPPCNTSGSCAGESCSELFDQRCIVYTGPDIQVYHNPSGENMSIASGERLDVILQYMLNVLGNSGDPETFTTQPYGLRISNVTSTGFTIEWSGDAAEQYKIYAQQQSPIANNTVTPTIGSFSYTYSNLVSGKEYKVNIEDAAGFLSGTLTFTLP